MDQLCWLDNSCWQHFVHKFDNRRTNGQTDGRTNGQRENIMPLSAGLTGQNIVMYFISLLVCEIVTNLNIQFRCSFVLQVCLVIVGTQTVSVLNDMISVSCFVLLLKCSFFKDCNWLIQLLQVFFFCGSCLGPKSCFLVNYRPTPNRSCVRCQIWSC